MDEIAVAVLGGGEGEDKGVGVAACFSFSGLTLVPLTERCHAGDFVLEGGERVFNLFDLLGCGRILELDEHDVIQFFLAVRGMRGNRGENPEPGSSPPGSKTTFACRLLWVENCEGNTVSPARRGCNRKVWKAAGRKNDPECDQF